MTFVKLIPELCYHVHCAAYTDTLLLLIVYTCLHDNKIYRYFTDDNTCSDVCDQHCSPSPPKCACDHGYYLSSDNRTCIGK